ncbi:MAG: CoA pyrophosphatase [Actinomycetota bacterium]|nr:CoA pyrophosphatase [Actinomycetota bacterium]
MSDLEQRLKHALAARTPKRQSAEGSRAAAVLIPVVGNPETSLIFTLRTETLRSHSGQISFPGGSLDPGESPVDAALRESCEEIGLDPSLVRMIGELDTFPTFVSGFTVTPFVGWLEEMPPLRPNPHEVAEVLVVPLARLTDDIRAEAGFEHGGRTYPTEAWVWDDHVIWGVTARVVRNFLEVLGEAGLVDPPGATSSWRLPPPAAARA